MDAQTTRNERPGNPAPNGAESTQECVVPRYQQTLRLLRSDALLADVRPPYVSAARTHTGKVRHHNEDQYLVASIEHGLSILDTSVEGVARRSLRASPSVVAAVADGVGGIPGGDLASAMVIDALAECALRNLPALASDPADLLSLEEAVESALRSCQARMKETALRKGLDGRIATTLTLAYVLFPSVHILHVGDSRAYLRRNDQLVRLTRDQTVAQELRDAGVSALRPEFDHVLTNTVGGSSEALRLEAKVVQLEPGDVLFLCTDGVYETMSEAELANLLSGVRDQTSAEQALYEIEQRALEAGGPDNLTSVVLAFP